MRNGSGFLSTGTAARVRDEYLDQGAAVSPIYRRAWRDSLGFDFHVFDFGKRYWASDSGQIELGLSELEMKALNRAAKRLGISARQYVLEALKSKLDTIRHN
jgi:hypothetical protein